MKIGFGRARGHRLAFAIVLPLLLPGAVSAQGLGQASLFSAAPTSGMLAAPPVATPRGDIGSSGAILPPQTGWPPSTQRPASAVPMGAAGQALPALSAGFRQEDTAD